jgi:hypothetical protein
MVVIHIKYIGALVISVLFLLGLVGPSMTIDFWHKMLYGKEESKEKKKKDYKLVFILWGVLTISLFVFVIFFVR